MKTTTRNNSFAFVLVLIATMAMGTAKTAYADPENPTPDERTKATQLFAEGTQFLAANDPSHARRKLEDAERIAPGYGIELNLGDCYEKLKRYASAWAMFKKAAATARANGQSDRESSAVARAAVVEPRVSYLTIVVPPEARLPEMKFVRDNIDVDPAEIGQPIPVDFGFHSIWIFAPDHKSGYIQVGVAEGKHVEQPIELLAPLNPKAAASLASAANTSPSPQPITITNASTPAPPSSSSFASKTAGPISLGVGAVGLVTGTVLLVLAKNKHDASDNHCKTSDRCDSEGVSQRDAAVDLANGATVSFAVGLVGLAAGAVLVWAIPALSKSATARNAFFRDGRYVF